MATAREIKEGIQYQGADENIVYTLTTTNWGSSPSSPSAKIFEMDGDTLTDVTTTKMTGAASEAGDVITLPAIALLSADTKYRVEVKFTISGNVFEAYAFIHGET